MKKSKLLKSIWIPALGIPAIGSIAAVCTSCGNVSVTGVTLDMTSKTLAVGETETLRATVLPENVTDKTVAWTSSNYSVVTVYENGQITAVGLGIATITAKTKDCYKCMFNGCSALNSIKIGYTGNNDSTYFDNWVDYVADSGIFYYNGNDSASNFGFPSGWTKIPFN